MLGGCQANAGQGTTWQDLGKCWVQRASTWGLLGLEMLLAFVDIPGYIPLGPQEGPGQAESLLAWPSRAKGRAWEISVSISGLFTYLFFTFVYLRGWRDTLWHTCGGQRAAYKSQFFHYVGSGNTLGSLIANSPTR